MECNKFDAAEILLPVEIRAKVVQTFPRPERRVTTSPDTVGLAVNNITQQKSDSEIKQPEKQQNQNNDSSPPFVNMSSHANAAEPDTEACDSIASYGYETDCENSQKKDVERPITLMGHIRYSTKTSSTTTKPPQPAQPQRNTQQNQHDALRTTVLTKAPAEGVHPVSRSQNGGN